MVRVGGRGEDEGRYAEEWEKGEGMASLAAFPQPEAPPVGAHSAPLYAEPPASVPAEENGAWSFEATGIYSMETASELVGAGDEEAVEVRGAGTAQSTHVLAVPPRPWQRTWQRMPKNIRRALLVFCIVGTVALLTDAILLALSFTHHRTMANAPISPSWDSQVVGSPVPGATLAPTMTMPLSTLVLSVQRLTFSGTVGQANPAPQTITLSGLPTGATWRIEPANGAPAWLHLSAWQGKGTVNSTVPLIVSARPGALASGFYTTNLQVRAFDAQSNPLAGSPETLAVVLNLHSPCTLDITPAKLSFGSVLGSVPASQTLTLSASSACALPLSWQVSSDVSWLTFSQTAGTLSGSGGSIVVQAITSGKLIGSYLAHITLRGTDGSGLGFVTTPATVSVTLTVIA
ncbi:MAG TPA: hypothetical protein VF458_14030 [Ktedonobacteraceae bacterium]